MAGVLKKLFLVALCAVPCAGAQAAPPGEYEVKAAFVYNIAKFVEWPAGAPASGSTRMCLLGEDPSGGAFDVLQGKFVGELRWEVVRVSVGDTLKACRVLFIASSERANLGRILTSLAGSPVLTVGDTEGYAGQGVMVNFYPENNRVRFEINRQAAVRAGLKMDSKLLGLARLVAGGGK